MRVAIPYVRCVYLAGSIDGISKTESQSWRVIAYDQLSMLGIVSTVPGLETVKLNSQQIVKLDNNMIHLSDAILINLNFLTAVNDKRLGTGSLCELGMGLAWGKLIIGFIDGGVLPDHCKFLSGSCDKVVSTLDEAINEIEIINGVASRK